MLTGQAESKRRLFRCSEILISSVSSQGASNFLSEPRTIQRRLHVKAVAPQSAGEGLCERLRGGI